MHMHGLSCQDSPNICFFRVNATVWWENEITDLPWVEPPGHVSCPEPLFTTDLSSWSRTERNPQARVCIHCPGETLSSFSETGLANLLDHDLTSHLLWFGVANASACPPCFTG